MLFITMFKQISLGNYLRVVTTHKLIVPSNEALLNDLHILKILSTTTFTLPFLLSVLLSVQIEQKES